MKAKEIQLGVDAENKYYLHKLTNYDIRKELIDNGFKCIKDEVGDIVDFEFDGRKLKNIKLKQHENFEVFMEIEIE